MNLIRETFRRCFDYSGRSRRREYWIYAFLTFAVLNVVGFIEDLLGLDRASGGPDSPFGTIALVGLTIPGLAVSVRRLHDSDRSAWWLLLPVAPMLGVTVALVAGVDGERLFPAAVLPILAGPLILLIFMGLPGTRGPNRFGPDPRPDSLADIFA